MMRLQKPIFDQATEYDQLIKASTGAGGISVFTGLMRPTHLVEGEQHLPLASMTIEHYPGMTENVIAQLESEAHKRWFLKAVHMVHRYGEILPQEPIVFVGTSAQHRDDAFAACRFLIDNLKTQAPFWKKENLTNGTTYWVKQSTKDRELTKKWGFILETPRL